MIVYITRDPAASPKDSVAFWGGEPYGEFLCSMPWDVFHAIRPDVRIRKGGITKLEVPK